MHSFRSLIVLVLVFAPQFVSPQESRQASKQLWSWFRKCSENRYMGLEVVQSGTVIYRQSFPVCPVGDRPQEVQKTLVFSFKGGHVFQGEYHTAPDQIIEGNIWQAGRDAGVMLLGISFSTKKQVLLNTIHIAKPDTTSLSEIDPGITVRTFPISRKR